MLFCNNDNNNCTGEHHLLEKMAKRATFSHYAPFMLWLMCAFADSGDETVASC